MRWSEAPPGRRQPIPMIATLSRNARLFASAIRTPQVVVR
ncbi:hypothetical protein P376_1296 [Streptomyces sp. HCCB10043]|nr:hypothetical protein P376_1296 [Streptomyces sp. HCCB10043]